MANSVSSLIKTIKSANSESLTLCCQIDKTFLFHLSLPFPGCFDVKVHRISDEFMDFHCCCDMLSNLLRNCRISDLMMNHQASMMAKPSSPFYMLPVFYEGLHNVAPVATWLFYIQCLLDAVFYCLLGFFFIAFQKLYQSSMLIVNFVLHSFLEYWHKIMVIQWISCCLNFHIRCWLVTQ